MLNLPNLTNLTDKEKDELILLLWEQNQLLMSKSAIFEAKIKQLEDQLAKNSRNSSKPPSSDGYKKPNPKSRRERGKYNQGGQKGHKGITLKQVRFADEVVIHAAKKCGQCGEQLGEAKKRDGEIRQVFDIPEIEIKVTEHRSYKRCCQHCGYVTAGQFPDGVKNATQYGPRIKSVMVYLSQYQLLPYGRLKELFKDLFKQTISEGTIANANREMYVKLDKIEGKIKGLLVKSGIMHADETGMRINKINHWLHVASTKYLTYYDVHRKRGREAADEIGILPAFEGILIHDHLKSYFKYASAHGLCNAHHLRELVFIQEQYQCQWAKQMEEFLVKTKKRVEHHYQKEGKVYSEKVLKGFYSKYKNIIYEGRLECPSAKGADPAKAGRVKESPARNLLNRLREFSKETLAFMFNPEVPFDNNQAERDIRMTKVKQKISGCFRSEMGAKMFCRIRGYISTMKKHGYGILEAIYNSFIKKRIPILTAV